MASARGIPITSKHNDHLIDYRGRRGTKERCGTKVEEADMSHEILFNADETTYSLISFIVDDIAD
ncbi:hypothetical protein MSIMFI_05085 [Mycobacterium simulans]|nr:hypothetical protein MSIMFI_05085 [Mycobacterium simulans]